MKSILILISLLTLVASQLTAIPDEDKFTLVGSNTQAKFELDPTTHEAYLSFMNNVEDSDISINLAKGQGYTVSLYIYTQYSDIKQNSDGSYTNFKVEINLNNKLLVLKKEDVQLPKGKLFFVLKDTQNYYYDDYITIFNEKDELVLLDNQPFLIKKYLSSNEYTFHFSCTKGQKVEILIKKENEENQTDITILQDSTEIAKSTGTDNFKYLIENKSGDFIMTLKNTKDAYIEANQLVLLYINEDKYTELKPDTLLKLSYAETKDFYFYANLNDYKLKEQNTITLKVNFQTTESELVDTVFGKVASANSYSEEEFDKFLEEAKTNNEIIAKREDNSDTYYTIFFANLAKKNKNHYLIFTFKLNHNSTANPDEVSVGLSSPIEIEELFSKEEDKLSLNISIKTDIPKYYQFNLETHEFLSYLLYSSLDDVQTVYNYTLLKIIDEEKSVNTRKIKRKIVALPKSKEDPVLTYTVKFFGDENTFNFNILGIKSDLEYYSSQYRETKRFDFKMRDCSLPYYIIGDYTETSQHFFFYEEIFGGMKVYYKTDFTTEDILPTEDDLIKENLIDISAERREIIKLQCFYPSAFNIHFVGDSAEKTATKNGRNLILLQQGKTVSINLPTDGNGYNYQFFTPLKHEISGKFNTDTQFTLTASNPTFENNIGKVEAEIPVEFTSNDGNTVVQILVSKGLSNFNVLQEGVKTYYQENFILEIKNSLDYQSVIINTNAIQNGITYQFGRVKNKIDYIGFPELSGTERNMDAHQISLVISNPYEQMLNADTPYKDNDPFYITFSTYFIAKSNALTFDIKYVPIQSKEIEPITTFFTDEAFPAIKTKIEKSNSISVIAHECVRNSVERIDFKAKEDLIQYFEYNTTNNLNYYITRNYPLGYDIKPVYRELKDTNYSGVEFIYTYNRLDTEKIEKLNINYTIKEHGSNLTWSKVEGFDSIKYIVYSFSKNFTKLDYVKNDCFLQGLKAGINAEDFKIEETENNTFIKDSNFPIVSVVANINDNDFKFRMFLDNVGKEDEKKEKKKSLLWLYITLPVVVIFVCVIMYLLLRTKPETATEVDVEDINKERLVGSTASMEGGENA